MLDELEFMTTGNVLGGKMVGIRGSIDERSAECLMIDFGDWTTKVSGEALAARFGDNESCTMSEVKRTSSI